MANISLLNVSHIKEKSFICIISHSSTYILEGLHEKRVFVGLNVVLSLRLHISGSPANHVAN